MNMKDFVYVFKEDIRSDLINVLTRLQEILKRNDEEGFSSYDEPFSIYPALFRLYAHLWMKNKFDLFKKKYITYDR